MFEETPKPVIIRLAGSCLLVVLTVVAITFSGCGGGAHDQSGDAICASEPAEVTAKRVQAYSSTVKTLLGARNCASCHGGTGSSAPYLYLSADDNQALGIASTLVNFEDMPNSRFIKKVLSDHNCGAHDQCVALSNEISNSIQAWANQVSALPSYTCESGRRVVLTSVQMNSTDLSTTVDKPLRWDVGAVIPELGKVWFRINAKLVAAPGTNAGAYQLNTPMIATSDSKIHIKDMRVIIESLASINALNFVDLNFILDVVSFNPTATWNVPKLSESTQLVSFQNGQNLGFSFLIEKSQAEATAVDTAIQCRVPELFQTVISTVYQGTSSVALETGFKCLRCHGNSANAAFTAFPQSGPGVDGCLEALLRADFNTPLNSLLILKPDTQIPNHPVREVLSTPQKNAITAWIAAEKAAAGL